MANPETIDDVPLRLLHAFMSSSREKLLKSFAVVVERCPQTGLYVGYVPGFPGAHSQGESLDELRDNMREVIAMLLEDGEPTLEAEFVGVESVEVN